MYVQPSVEDDRLTDLQKKISNYILLHAINAEINEWIKAKIKILIYSRLINFYFSLV